MSGLGEDPVAVQAERTGARRTRYQCALFSANIQCVRGALSANCGGMGVLCKMVGDG